MSRHPETTWLYYIPNYVPRIDGMQRFVKEKRFFLEFLFFLFQDILNKHKKICMLPSIRVKTMVWKSRPLFSETPVVILLIELCPLSELRRLSTEPPAFSFGFSRESVSGWGDRGDPGVPSGLDWKTGTDWNWLWKDTGRKYTLWDQEINECE